MTEIVQMRPEDYRWLEDLNPDELRDVNLMVYQKWDNTRRFLDGLNDNVRCSVKRDRQFMTFQRRDFAITESPDVDPPE